MPPTLLEIIGKSTSFLAAKGVENARLDAEILIGHALGLKRMQLYLQFERPLSEPELESIRPLLRRRSQREPLQYILGNTEWAGLTLKTDKRALIPRPETEYLVELVQQRASAPANILDLGTGTGALALALAKLYPEAQVTAADASEDALSLARENAVANQLENRIRFLQSNWFDSIPKGNRFDLIVSNPPYLTEEEYQEASPEVQVHEPRSALVAANKGMSDLETIITQSPSHLSENGILALETGIAQHPALLTLAQSSGFHQTESLNDLTGRPRFLFFKNTSFSG